MQPNQADNIFELSPGERLALRLKSDRTTWPMSDATGLLQLAEDMARRNEDVDPSEFPAGAGRNSIIERKRNTATFLSGLISDLTPFLPTPGDAAEEFLREING
jgi:hypothetical protein